MTARSARPVTGAEAVDGPAETPVKARRRVRRVASAGPVPGVLAEAAPAPVVCAFEPGASAREVALQLPRGGRMLVVTRGQFSLLDMIHAILERTGPASVMFTSWSTGLNDADQMRWLLDEGHIRTLRFFSGNGFQDRHPEYVTRLRALFGDDCVVTAELHAKIAVIVNDGWAVCVRSSCNLNRNPRIEQFDVDDSRPMAEWLLNWSESLATTGAKGWDPADRGLVRDRLKVWGGEWCERPATRAIAARPGPAVELPIGGAVSGLPYLRQRYALIAAEVATARGENRPTDKLLPLERDAAREIELAEAEERAATVAESPLDRARRYRTDALMAGKLPLVERWTRTITELEAEAEAARKAAARAALAATPSDALVTRVGDMVLSMPPHQRRALKAILNAAD